MPAHGGADAPGVLYAATDWDEIRAYLLADAQPPNPQPPRVPRVLSVAGSDSGGGAGLQADIKAATACGAFVTTAVTAVTVQNTGGVRGVHTVPERTVIDQV